MKNIYFIVPLLATCACSPVMEANRPDPVDLKQFVVGEPRSKVLGELGSPLTSTQEDDNLCDLYKLYTRGPDGVGKAAIATGEIVADVFTLGLTEIVFTPVEAGTKNTKHAVTFCYDDDEKLVTLQQSDGATGD